MPPTKPVTVRFSGHQLRKLERLRDEMACDSNGEVLRIALNFLQLNEHRAYREQIKLDNLAKRFTQRLVDRYGADEELEVYLRLDGSVAYSIGEVEPNGIRVEANHRRDNDLVEFVLIDATMNGHAQQIGISRFVVVPPEEVEDGQSVTRTLGEIHRSIGGTDGPASAFVSAQGITED